MERKVYCDYLRLVATFAIVIIHVSYTNWYSTDVNEMGWQSLNFYDSIVRWGVPIFVMISGSLFLNRDIPIRTIYSKYILRLVVAFLTWSIFYALVTPEYFEDGIINGIKTHIGDMVAGHYHMWFVLMIIGIYMCIPFYKKITADSYTTKYFLLLSFIFAFVIPWIVQLLNDYLVEGHEQIAKLVSVINSHVTNMNMHMVLGYSFYFVLGYYLDSIELSKKQRIIIYLIGVLGFAFTVLVDLNLAIKTQQPCEKYYGYLCVNVLLEAICIHTLFKYHEFKNKKLNSFIVIITGYTFGLYLVHAFFIEKLALYFGFDTLSFNTIVAVPIVSVVVFGCALLVSAVLNHIPIIKKYCV